MTWEERWHPLRREWIIMAAHRNDRPWSGESTPPDLRATPSHDPECFLCPGNARVSGVVNPAYEGVHAFDNDHPCVGEHAPAELEAPGGLYRNRRADGVARVVCFTPRHDLSLGELEVDGVVAFLRELQRQYRELGARPEVNHVLVFENRGEAVGVSNPHPHCQIYATNFVFRTIELEAEFSAEHLAEHGRTLVEDIIAAEEADGRRILFSDERALAFMPYFARYPYEIFVTPRAPHASLADLDDDELRSLAEALRDTVIRYDNLWRTAFPYVMTFHQAPTDALPHPGFHFHVEIYPPLRKPALRKFLAGPEIGGGNFINSSPPEVKTAELRAVSGVHYKKGGR